MAHGPESVEFALKRVDRSKRFIVTAIVLLFIAVLFTFGFLLAHARADAGGSSKLLWAATAAQMTFVGICTVLVSFHVTRMTKTVLNALELTPRGMCYADAVAGLVAWRRAIILRNPTDSIAHAMG